MQRSVNSTFFLMVWGTLAAALVTGWSADKLPRELILTMAIWLGWSLLFALWQDRAGKRTELAGMLRHSRFIQIYHGVAAPVCGWLWQRAAGKAEKSAGPVALLRGVLTWQLYDFALRLAVSYPLLSLVLVWLLGNDARLGHDAILFHVTPFWPGRALVVGQIVILAAGLAAAHFWSSSPHRFLRKAAGWMPLLAVAGAFAGAFAFAGAVAFAFVGAGAVAFAVAVAFAGAGAFAFVGAGAGAVAFAVAGAVAFAVAGAVAFAGAGAGAVAFAVAFAIETLDRHGRQSQARLLLTLMAPLIWIAAAYFMPPAAGRDAFAAPLFVFFGVLPLINALFDLLSYAITLTLFRLGLEWRARGAPLICAAGDVLAALILWAGLGAAMVAVIAGLNAIAPDPVFDLGALFAGLGQRPGDYWWLYLMMFSTLVPTGLHLLLALLSAQAIMPRRLRARAAALVEAAPGDAFSATVAPLFTGAILTVPSVALVAALVGLWHLIRPVTNGMGTVYLTLLEGLARIIGAL